MPRSTRATNPFGRAESKPAGCEWGASRLLEGAGWLDEERRALGMRPLVDSTDEMAVLPCVDHEPTSGSADGNHASGLERYLTGYVGGQTSVLTMINYGLRERFAAATAAGEIALPAFSPRQRRHDPGLGRLRGVAPAGALGRLRRLRF